MTRIELAPEVLEDFERFIEHMQTFDVSDVPARLEEIVQAIDILAHSPAIGRPVKGVKRELLLGRGSRAYVALCRYLPELDAVFVLALRSQRERG
ncbi:type II toxin-antitoxin system RelE/ParE family toxin [Variovorax sp. LT1R16]|uniref:type II toxin-antitoxin system RelE/ParE family toxin n=1 Tax=Variovorax sp. LT1R16 TaxID=3443728 RepID=UPI003F467FF8